MPARTCAAVKKYLQERISRWEGCEAPAEPAPTAPLFVRNNGVAFDVSFLDRMVRRLASSASVPLPRDAAAHALRHHLGVQLALRRTPVPVIQQILGHADSRTTAVYTSIASSGLADALDEAGWL